MSTKNTKNNEGYKLNEQSDSIYMEQEPDTSFSFNQLFKDAGKQSLKALKWFLIVLLSFGFPNIILFIVSILKYGSRPFGESSLCIIIILLTGLCFTFFALYITYKYLLIDTLSIAYQYLTPLFKKICVKIIDKVISGGNRLTGRHDIEKTLNVGSLMIEVYGKQLPSYVRKSVIFILNRVPFNDFLFNMQDDLKSGRKDSRTLSEMLYLQLDSYIINTFFKGNSMKWMFWFLPLNIIIQVILLIFIK
ncbi:hypothetical protein CLV62_11531 [Dysgonomonas alginatilytica]|uniref:Uncharacterized protein n=1 Tax=Dysgonomonas alginatilytica TaxID=1605892 RepID=A0A2V3PP87_9BACT|nr:hypothetical protein [Dysgonomonas alginatilytica]PXV63149.1 hypothetical protein CLV62_11531 [Dysgonomonas alginatilytica]